MLRQPSGIGEVAADAGLERADSLLANQKPQLQGPKAASQRDAPVPEILDLRILPGLQVAGVGGHHLNQMSRVADEVRRAIKRRPHPFVGVEDQRVGSFDALPQPATLGKKHRRPGHRRIHVQPKAMPSGDLGDRLHRIHRDGRGGPHRGDDRRGQLADVEICGNGLLELLRHQRKLRVGLDQAQVGKPKPSQAHSLFHRAVGLLRCVDGHRRMGCLQALFHLSKPAGALAGTDQRDQGGRRGGVLKNSGEGLGKANHPSKPVHHDFFELGGRGTGLPAHRLRAQTGRHQIGQDRGQTGIGREIGEEARMAPVRHARQHHPPQVGQKRFHRLRFGRRLGGEQSADFAGLAIAHHPQLGQVASVLRDPIDQGVAEHSKFVRGHAPGI